MLHPLPNLALMPDEKKKKKAPTQYLSQSTPLCLENKYTRRHFMEEVS